VPTRDDKLRVDTLVSPSMAREQTLAVGALADHSSANSLTLCGPGSRHPIPRRAA
jgi:hypothetical protein